MEERVLVACAEPLVVGRDIGQHPLRIEASVNGEQYLHGGSSVLPGSVRGTAGVEPCSRSRSGPGGPTSSGDEFPAIAMSTSRVLFLQGHRHPAGRRFCLALAEKYCEEARAASREVRTREMAQLDDPLLGGWAPAANKP